MAQVQQKTEMQWAYAVTTVPSRYNTTLPKTLASLDRAGFPRPLIAVDGLLPLPETKGWPRYQRTYRKNIRTFGHWVLTAWELNVRFPYADRYAIFQDDFVTYKNLRQYLETLEMPSKGYWNLYTFPENEMQYPGWYLSPTQQGLGAVATIFDAETFRKLLASRHMTDRPKDKKRGHRAVDGAIVTALSKVGISEYVHNPSLVQHIGHKSSMGNRVHAKASTFRDEEFDAMDLVDEQKKAPAEAKGERRKRIGLVGYNARTGLGELNRQIATYCDIDYWLVKPHPKHPTLSNHEDCETVVCREGNNAKLEKFLKHVDVVVFCETDYYKGALAALARKHKKRVVCIPMLEWLPKRGWPQRVDLFICPTAQCYNEVCKEFPAVHFSWPVDIERFQFKKRTHHKHFLFINGHGGWGGRKGASVVKRAKQLWPEMPLMVRSQKAEDWPDGTIILPPTQDNNELYEEGEILLCPHSVDGLGLEPMEAMACGMPVISTDGQPWNEIPSIEKVQGRSLRRTIKRPVDWYQPKAEALVECCRRWYGRSDLAKYSIEARQWAELQRWSIRVEEFETLVRTGFHKMAVPFPMENGATVCG